MACTAPRRGNLGAAAAAAALLISSACGGGTADGGVASVAGEADPATAGTAGPVDEEAQALAFAECMREQGIDMPDPAPGQEGLRDAFHGADEDQAAAVADALAACEDLLPQRDHGDDGHGPDSEMVLELAECLREQGLEVSDDLFAGGGAHAGDDDEFRAAMEQCRGEGLGGDR